MVYLAGGGDLVGRGMGNWVSEGPVIGFQVEIFQYAASSAKHVHLEPHRFRGIAMVPNEGRNWDGEWYFCRSSSLLAWWAAFRHIVEQNSCSRPLRHKCQTFRRRRRE